MEFAACRVKNTHTHTHRIFERNSRRRPGALIFNPGRRVIQAGGVKYYISMLAWVTRDTLPLFCVSQQRNCY